mgnify:CR=1 FL=1
MLIEIKELSSGEHIAYLKDELGNNLIADVADTLDDTIKAARKIKEKYCKRQEVSIVIKVD